MLLQDIRRLEGDGAEATAEADELLGEVVVEDVAEKLLLGRRRHQRCLQDVLREILPSAHLYNRLS